jgi:hypothetical protein
MGTGYKNFLECIPLIVVFLVVSSLGLLTRLVSFFGGSDQLCLIG